MFIQKISAVNSNHSNSLAKSSQMQQQSLALPKELSHDSAKFSQVSFKGDCGKLEAAGQIACALLAAGF